MERIDIVTFVPSFLSKSLRFYLSISSFCPEFCNSVFTIPILSLWNLARGDLVPGVCFFFSSTKVYSYSLFIIYFQNIIFIYRCLLFNWYSVTFGVNILLAFINFDLVLAFIVFCHFDQIPGKNQLKEWKFCFG